MKRIPSQFFWIGISVFWAMMVAGATATIAVAADGVAVEVDMAQLIARGDIDRTHAPSAGDVWLPLYQGNGRFGSCFGPWGMHPAPSHRDYTLQEGSSFTHLKHWVRAKYHADYVLPLAAIHWEKEPDTVVEYHQHQSFYDGTVRTQFRTDAYRVDMLSWFDPVHRDVVGFQLDVEGDCPAILFEPFAPPGPFKFKYEQQLQQTLTAAMEGGVWKGTLRCLDRETPLKVQTSAGLEAVPQGAKITLKPGRNEILITVGSDMVASADESLHANIEGWHSLWQNSGWLDLPDDTAQKVWVRSLAYTNASHNDDGIGCPPPCGLVGAGWQFPFPFDSGCRQPLLLWTGRIEVAKAWLEFWHSRIDGLKKYTQRIWHKDGIMLPHVFPYGAAEDFHVPTPPNRMYYPVYNAGHLVRIAHQTAVMVNDPQWTHDVALPLIEGVARFYLDFAEKGKDGQWHFTITPSIGLDEHGGNDQPDYLCTLVSAEYAFRIAIQYGLDVDGRMQKILDDGIAYKSLLTPDGMYYGNAGSGIKEFGHQKHPDQLASVVHIPLGHDADAQTLRSYQLRYDVTKNAKKPEFAGHTGGEFILASARMHDVEGWRKDWSSFLPAEYCDPDWIQFYESSGNEKTFYVTTHGLVAQSLLETIVSTWWGRLDLAACLPWSGKVRFGNIRTVLGVTVSGEIVDGRGQATLHAWKDTSFSCQGRTVTLKKGEETSISIGQQP
jgi:hypothetical protein